MLLVSLIFPFIIFVGPLRLSVYRLVLLIFFFPVVFTWLRGGAGRIRLADLALLFFCAWSTLSYAVIHGTAVSIERGGIVLVETMGAYLLARCYIRNADSFLLMVRVLFWIIAILLPFAAFEALTGQNLLLKFFDAIYPSYRDVYKEPRWGMRRVQGPFEHPILFGVFCGSAVGLVHLVLGYEKAFVSRVFRSAIVSVAAFFSLSSGPLVAAGIQISLLLWNGVFCTVKSRWKILFSLSLIGWFVISMASNRSVPQIVISLLAFNTSSAWNRLRIWEYGSASVLKHPVFGIGLNDWERAPWMVDSVDMFWLVPAMRHGFPGGISLHLALGLVVLGILLRKGLSKRQNQFRTGFLITMAGFYISGWTVHYWNATYVLFMFLLGSGAWLLDAKPEVESGQIRGTEEAARQGPRYSRFPLISTRAPEAPPTVKSNRGAGRK
ncbi:hypothetical protein [Aliiroseovarius subalbicans]|uniref:O-antigen ligase family protein n=1 Tax=Aliiroseovarius subalbicans TaxID=2925840 RepID=UPI001F56CADC|nr:hypothetical protein [Aliiroseovarius subalbicans]MCI2401177.1 hypothetical protein [Aliiroseovarius subalbicans]